MTADLETALRETLDAEARALPSGPDSPFPAFARRERRHKRNRALRLSAVGVVAVLVAVQLNVIPIPGWVPGATAGHSAGLAQGPSRGPLAHDRKFLDDFRANIQDSAEDEGIWRVDRSAVDIVWAGDVPGARLVVADVPAKLMGITDWQLQIFGGTPGASGAEMDRTGSFAALDGKGQALGQVMTSDSAPGYAFVLGPPGSKVELKAGFRYGPDGRIHRGKTIATGTDGVAMAELPPMPLSSAEMTVFATVTKADGHVVYDGVPGAGSAGDTDSEIARRQPQFYDPLRGVSDDMITKALAGRSFDRAWLRQMVAASLQQAKLVAGQVKLTVPWTGAISGQPAAMWSVQPAGGGVVTFLAHGTSSDGAVLQPADGAGIRPLGWRLRGEASERKTDRVAVVAPAAATVTLAVEGRGPEPVTLDADGFALINVPSAARAHLTATTPDGGRITTLIPPFESFTGGIPGMSPGTTVVE